MIPTNAAFLKSVVESLFPIQRPLVSTIDGEPLRSFDPVTEEEIILAAAKVDVKKAPGPDGVPNKALKLAVQQCAPAFLQVFNTCFTHGTFPQIWKKQSLF